MVVFYYPIVNSWRSFAVSSTSGGGPSCFRGRQLSPATPLCSESSRLLCLHWANLPLRSLSDFDSSPAEISFFPCHLLYLITMRDRSNFLRSCLVALIVIQLLRTGGRIWPVPHPKCGEPYGICMCGGKIWDICFWWGSRQNAGALISPLYFGQPCAYNNMLTPLFNLHN